MSKSTGLFFILVIFLAILIQIAGPVKLLEAIIALIILKISCNAIFDK